jgi:hypothetical protein
MNVGQLRGWLLQIPKPLLIRVTVEGERTEIKPGKQSYARLAETIVALGPELVECLGGDGDVLRAKRMTDVESQRSDAAALPAVLQMDPNAAMLTHFANLIHRAYEHSTEIAFVKLAEITDKMGDRADAIERRLERTEATNRKLLQDQVDDAFDRAQDQADRAVAEAEASGGSGALEGQLLNSFLGGQQLKGNVRSTNGAPKPGEKS